MSVRQIGFCSICNENVYKKKGKATAHWICTHRGEANISTQPQKRD